MDVGTLYLGASMRPDDQEEGLDLDRVRRLGDQQLALVVDDDPDTVQLLKLTLQRAGINVIGALDGHDALAKCAETSPNVILLDLMMPIMDGWQTMQQLSAITMAPVLVISAIINEDSVVRALAEGAEDYIRKPFSAKEVVARVQAALRRSQLSSPPKVLVLPGKGLWINLETRQVKLHDRFIKLSQQEYSVLAFLVQHSPDPVAYETIGEKIWGEYNPQAHKRLKWVIHQLRKKLKDDHSNPRFIMNYRNFGYQLLQ
jgi:two-component system KDP operon response regulator KdpE